MTHSISLLLGVHATSPSVISGSSWTRRTSAATAVSPDSAPFSGVPLRHPFQRLLLDYLLQKYPEDMALLREMVGRGQAELFGAGIPSRFWR